MSLSHQVVRRAAVAALLSAALAAQHDGATPADVRDPACYMPLLPGTQWTWKATWTGDDGKPYEHVHRARVWGLVPVGQGNCSQVVYEGMGRWAYYAIRAEGLVQFDNALIGGPGASAGSQPILPAPVGAETRWTWSTEITYQTASMPGTVHRPRPPEYSHHVGELLDFDVEVTVPAGTFRCAHVRQSRRGKDGTLVPESDQWYGRGVGLVREVDHILRSEQVLTAFAPVAAARADRELVLRAWLRTQADGATATFAWLPPEEWSHYLHGDLALVRRGDRLPEPVFVDGGTVTPFALDDAAFWRARLEYREPFLHADPMGGADRVVPVAERTRLRCEHVAAAIASLRAAQLGVGVDGRHDRELKQNFAPDTTTCSLREVLRPAVGEERVLRVQVNRVGDVVTIAVVEQP